MTQMPEIETGVREGTALSMRLVRASSLAEWREALTTLSVEAVEPNPFLAPWNLFPALETLEETSSMDYALAFDGERLVGFLPLEKKTGYAHLPITYHRTGMHRHCFLGTPLIAKGYEHRFFDALINIPLKSSFIQFRHMAAGGPVETALAEIAGAANGYVAATWQRAALDSSLSYEQYLLQNIRGKKRKEWRRLTNRLSDEGVVSFSVLDSAEDLPSWTDIFVQMEHEGWRGHGGSSLQSEPSGPEYLQSVLAGAFDAGELVFLRLCVDEKCIGMLINFTGNAATGRKGWSFKIAHDPDYARYSPGVMIELELTRRSLDEGLFSGIDSCAREDHPMIDKIWAERQVLNHWNVPLPGLASRSALSVCHLLETAADRTRDLLGTRGISA